MRDTQTQIPARASGTFDMGGELTVNRLGFGAMRLTGDGVWGEPGDAEECRRVLRRAVELGVNLIDTADATAPSCRRSPSQRRSSGSRARRSSA